MGRADRRSDSPNAALAAYRPPLVRRRQRKVIAGVCGALATRFGLSPTLVRVGFVASLFLPGPQILAYLVLWVLIPVED